MRVIYFFLMLDNLYFVWTEVVIELQSNSNVDSGDLNQISEDSVAGWCYCCSCCVGRGL